MAVFVLWRVIDRGGDAESSGFVFDQQDEVAPESDRLVVPSLIDPRLVTRLELPVVVRSGGAEEFERIVPEPPDRVLPVDRGEVVVGLARAGEQGRVVLTGPAGWMDGACVVASITSGFVPLDVVHWKGPGGCSLSLPGQAAVEDCRGEQTVVFAIEVPQQPVPLPTGGEGVAESLRVQLVHEVPGFEVASVRGRVDVADLAVEVPTLSGAAGQLAEFELGGAGARVSCVFT
ncbi:MAG: hypothetical protein OEW42_04760 [Acidimicrobiia bacterium]|nr:hypothetical protein [Acidimicrobiia bacterium]MDH5237513.1 hypothetical protein [Acidimicrobiia bacterium]